ncbi:MAG: hypothetical protein WC107_04000 [Patescibacteria group bacterium]
MGVENSEIEEPQVFEESEEQKPIEQSPKMPPASKNLTKKPAPNRGSAEVGRLARIALLKNEIAEMPKVPGFDPEQFAALRRGDAIVPGSNAKLLREQESAYNKQLKVNELRRLTSPQKPTFFKRAGALMSSILWNIK